MLCWIIRSDGVRSTCLFLGCPYSMGMAVRLLPNRDVIVGLIRSVLLNAYHYDLYTLWLCI
jgi:hypothetical protein